jgi:outer membrane protein OmpA-like peptidoglycan-associated protein
MKIRMLALAGAAAVALSAPATAAPEGWYLGLAGGYDNMPTVNSRSAPFPTAGVVPVDHSDSGIGMLSFGYSWASGFRLENEFSYTSHDIDSAGNGGAGSTSVMSSMFNLVYDIPLDDQWKISIGGGAGIGNARLHWTVPAGAQTLDYVKGSHVSLEYQAIAGIAYSMSPDVDLFVDYRYRANQNDATYNSSFAALTPIKVGTLTENAFVVGLRWFMTPPPPPPPAKTYIVFFDFDKSDLTAEAQSTVTQAVSAAKTLGSVRIMVTGHTDTMGSDKYNQALSVRRATTVKDEMVRQGMGSDTIAIEGKSFHDPMVPTGPNVREPKNRRAFIDLGG